MKIKIPKKICLSAMVGSSALSLLFLAPGAMAGGLDFSRKLTAPNGAAEDLFGRLVALDGNLALVGAYGDDDKSGSAYLFDTLTGSLLQKFTDPDGADLDNFGFSVALDGNLALVGSHGDDNNNIENSGSAYLFDTVSGSLLHKFTAPDGAYWDLFGYSVALDGNRTLIAAHRDDDKGGDSGSVYLFDTFTGSFLQKLTAPDGSDRDDFGVSVALDGNLALVGAHGDDGENSSGSAYLFDTVSGSLLHKFTPSDGAYGSNFGISVALDGNLALIGAHGENDNGNNSGSAYLFDTVSGSLVHKFTPSDGAEFDYFGVSVAVDGNLALVGAHRDDDNGNSTGSAYLFDTVSGSLLQKLTAPDAADGDYFGFSVALDGNQVLVSALGDDDKGTESGSLYLFESKSVPEPSLVIGLAVFGVLATALKHNQK